MGAAGSKIFLLLTFSVLVALIISVVIIKKEEKNPKQKIGPKPLRQPAVAGSFYPADKKLLNQQLDGFLQKAQKVKIAGKRRILIVPHAGIVYSGQVAGWGFKQIEKAGFKRVILLGPSHQAWFNHAAVDSSGLWQTPLGKVAIDEDFANRLIDEKQILADKTPFTFEHSLEVELIFLQKVLPDFTIVPILVSNPSNQLIDSLAEKLAQNFDDQTLLVVSSDLSHYPPYETANQADKETINGILSGKKETFEETIKTVEGKNYPGLETAACGQKAISVALKTAQLLEVTNFQKIKYQNSGDVSGDKSRVVGYVAIIGWSEKLAKKADYLDNKAQKEALEIARKTLQEFLTNKKIPEIKPKNPALLQPLGAFVTLRNKGRLRGCIGQFESEVPLYQVIQKMTVAAAQKEFRFPPVEKSELQEIKIEVSILSPKRKINDWKKIKLGKHGVVVEKGLRSGTFLPQVADESGWGLEYIKWYKFFS